MLEASIHTAIQPHRNNDRVMVAVNMRIHPKEAFDELFDSRLKFFGNLTPVTRTSEQAAREEI